MSKESQRIFQQQQSQDLKYLKEKFNQLQLNKELADKALNRSLEGLNKEKVSEAEKAKLLERQISLKEKLSSIQRQQVDIAEKAKMIDPNLQGFKGAGTTGSPTSSPMGSPSGLPTEEKGLISNLVRAIGIQRLASMIASGIQGTANFAVQSTFEYDQSRTRQQAGITQGIYKASGASDIMSGRGLEAQFFNPERMKAFQNAQRALGGMSVRGGVDLLTSTGLGAVSGGALGAGLGSVIPGLGTAVGATAGSAIGAVGGFGRSIFSGQTGAGLKSLVGEGSYGAGVERFRAMQFAEDFKTNLEAEKAKDPFKQQALGFLEGNRDRFLQNQQISGMGDKSFFDYMSAGDFTIGQKTGMMGTIAGAGGSTAQVRNANQALQLQRGYGIQNAGQILGGLSGQIGGSGQADNAVRKVLADAFSIGLDASNFSRETERFVQASSHFIQASGTRNAEAANMIGSEMSNFITDGSMAGIQSGTQARERFEDITGKGGSQYAKALGISKMRGTFKNLDESQLTYLNQLSYDQIQAGGPVLEQIAQKEGISLSELQEKMGGVQEFKLTSTSGQAKSLDKMRNLRSKISKESNPETKKQLEQALASENMEFVTSMAMTGQLEGLDQYAGMDFAKGASMMGTHPKGKGPMPARGEGIFDLSQKAEALSEGRMMGEIRKYEKDYADSARNMANISGELAKALSSLTDAIKSEDEKLKQKASQDVINIMSKQQNVKTSGFR